MPAVRRAALRPLAVARIGLSLVRLAARRDLVEVGWLGNRIVADLRVPHGLELYRYGHTGADGDVEFVAGLLRPGDAFIDCGANDGLFTVAGSRAVGPSGLVVAFEPAPRLRANLERNLALNALAQAAVLPHAVSDQPGEASFVVTPGGGGHSSFAPAIEGETITVPTVALDAVLPLVGAKRVALVKMDVEGAEVAALRGAGTLLNEHRPLLFVEVEDAHLRRQRSSADELRQLLADHGYREADVSRPPNVLFTAER